MRKGVLLRAVAIPGEPERLAAGPALLARCFGINRSHDAQLVHPDRGLWLAPRPPELAALAAAVGFTRLGADFIPQLDEGSISIQFVRAASLDLRSSVELQKKSEALLRERFPEIDHVFARIGTAEIYRIVEELEGHPLKVYADEA